MFQPGDQIGRYEIQRRLGRGGMGTVYLAHHPVLGRLVAIKVFSIELTEPDAADRFAREAGAATALNHPNIVTIHDYGEVESRPFVVMEYVPGGTLADIIRRKTPAALTQKLRWIEELCSGASYAHRTGVLHRDIKPANLMINRAGQLKVLDFGIAGMMNTMSPKGTALVGTPGYLAPEQILGELVDHRADLFSIGVVCYELIVYRDEAFPGETPATITVRIPADEPLPLRDIVPDLPSGLIALVERSLRKNPAERFEDAESLRAAIARVRRELESDADWQPAAPTVIIPRPGAGARPREAGSISDGDTVAAPGPRAQSIDREALARRRTEQIEATLARARASFASGDLDAARDACVRALILDETHAGALDLEQRIEAAMASRHADALLREAAHEIDRQSLDSAEALLQQARVLDPGNPELSRHERDLRLVRAEAARRQQHAEEAAAALARARQALTQGRAEEAIAAAREALVLDARLPIARKLKAEATRLLDAASSSIEPETPPPATKAIVHPPQPIAARPSPAPSTTLPGLSPAKELALRVGRNLIIGFGALLVVPVAAGWEAVTAAGRFLRRERVADEEDAVAGDEPAGDARRTPASFAAFAPGTVARDRSFILEIWAYAPVFKDDAWRLASRGGIASMRGEKGPVPVPVGATLMTEVALPAFDVDPPADRAVWDGKMVTMSFAVKARADVATGVHVGTARIMADSIPIAVLHFELTVGAKRKRRRTRLPGAHRRIRSVFASYASEDRIAVLQWARGATSVGVDVFIDVLKLRESDRWEAEIRKAITAKDLFCLFWSAAASRSPWVQREWRCALATRGLDYIHPVPLEDPRLVPPPPELSAKHFGGVLFMAEQYEKLAQDHRRAPL